MSGGVIRVGQVIQSVDVEAGGTSSAFLNILAALRSYAGLDVRPFSAPPPAGDPAWSTIDADAERWTLTPGYGRFLDPGPFGRAVIQAINAHALDIVHLHGLWSPDLMAIGLACRRAGVPYLWQPHGMLVRAAYARRRLKKQVFMALGMRRVLSGAAGFIFVTHHERDSSILPGALPTERRHVVPLPVTVPRLAITPQFRRAARERLGIPSAAPTVVFMGRIHPVKRLGMAVAALAIASRTRPGLHLLVVGGGDERDVAEVRQAAESRGMADRIHLAGWVRGDDKWGALAAGDILTLNSVHENFGYVAPEALCVGTLPVLTSNLALAQELGDAGLAVIAEPDERSLADAYLAALARADPQGTLERGRAWVATHLGPEVIGQALGRLYSSLPRKPENAA